MTTTRSAYFKDRNTTLPTAISSLKHGMATIIFKCPGAVSTALLIPVSTFESTCLLLSIEVSERITVTAIPKRPYIYYLFIIVMFKTFMVLFKKLYRKVPAYKLPL
jgi:hypothetical protein